MVDRSGEWDAAIERTRQTGVMTNADRLLALTSCPTCCDTGLDEGSPCLDCPTGLALIPPEEIIRRQLEADKTHHWVKDSDTHDIHCQDCYDRKGTLLPCFCPRA